MSLIFTRQHVQLDPAQFGLDGFPSVHIHCPAQPDPHGQVGAVTKALLPLLIASDLLIVQGGTSSALGGALAATLVGVPVGHVEAGLRSHDRHRSWPEEELRMAVDSRADLLFAPTELNAANLRRERVGGRIYVTGNSGIDAILRTLRSIPGRSCDRAFPHLLVTWNGRDNWGQSLAEVACALRMLAREQVASFDVILHPNPTVAAQMRLFLTSEPGINLHNPCSHPKLIELMLAADLVLSNSGGMEEEAAALGVPLLILSDTTERPEAVATGHLGLVGIDSSRIAEVVRQRLAADAPAPHASPYGDGRSAGRIALIIDEWLRERNPDLFYMAAEPPPDARPDNGPITAAWYRGSGRTKRIARA